MKIQALVFDGFDEMDVFGTLEALSMGGFRIAFKSLHEQQIVTAAYGTRIEVDGKYSLDEQPDVLLVPGGGWITRAARGAWAEAQDGRILQVLRESHQAGVILAAVCTGSLLLAQAGLLKDRPATTNHGAISELIESGARYIKARVVDGGQIVTAGGITSSIDLGIWLIERFKSQAEAISVSERLEFERRGVVFMDA